MRDVPHSMRGRGHTLFGVAFHRAMTAAVNRDGQDYPPLVRFTFDRFRFGAPQRTGFVAKYMGDGVLVYFGYPQAHEDDADPGVRAGLQLIGAVAALSPQVSLQTRVGIATGLGRRGRLDRIGGRRKSEASSTKSRTSWPVCTGVAQPNMVIIARRLLGNHSRREGG
jgi:hypothetical protein